MVMDTNSEQDGQEAPVSLDPVILNDVMHERILALTSQNLQLGAYVKQLKSENAELKARQDEGRA